ncbi:hypothetical protein Taro_050239, partial [Colocasia esculenta]|nr:hypothetical protein [Colocasia esculenta]
QGTDVKESGQKSNNVSQDFTRPPDIVSPPSGLKNAAANQHNSKQDSKQSITPSSSTEEGPPNEEVSNTADKNGLKNAAVNQDNLEQDSKASTTSSSSRNQGPPKEEVSNTADKKGSSTSGQGINYKESGHKSHNISKDSTKPVDNVSLPLGSKDVAVSQDNSEQQSKASTTSSSSMRQGPPKEEDLKQSPPPSSSTKQGPPKEEVSDTADKKDSSFSEQGTNDKESVNKSDNISKDSTKPVDNVSPPSGSKNAAENQENSNQNLKQSTKPSSSTNEGPPKVDNVSPPSASKNAPANQDNPEQDSKTSTRSSSSKNQGITLQNGSRQFTNECPSAASLSGQGTNDMNSGQKSDDNISKDSTKQEGNVSPPVGSKNEAEKQYNSNQDLKQSTTPSSSTNEGTPKVDNVSPPSASKNAPANQDNPEHDSKTSTRSSGSKNQGIALQNGSRQFTNECSSAASPSGQGTNDMNSGQKSDDNISKDSTKQEGNVSPPVGSKNEVEKQDNSNQDLKQSTTPSSSTNEGTPKGTNYKESGQKSHISKASTKPMDNVSPPLGSKNAAVNQDDSEQNSKASTTSSGSTNQGPPKEEVSNTADKKGSKNAAVNQDNSEQDSKASTTLSSSRNQGPPKEEVSNTADKKGSSPSGQGTNDKESGHKSDNNISKDSTKPVGNVSPPSGWKNAAANQDSHNSVTGSEQTGSPSAGTSQSPS